MPLTPGKNPFSESLLLFSVCKEIFTIFMVKCNLHSIKRSRLLNVHLHATYVLNVSLFLLKENRHWIWSGKVYIYTHKCTTDSARGKLNYHVSTAFNAKWGVIYVIYVIEMILLVLAHLFFFFFFFNITYTFIICLDWGD